MKLRPLIHGCAVVFDATEGEDMARKDALGWMRHREEFEPDSIELCVFAPERGNGAVIALARPSAFVIGFRGNAL